MTQFCVISKDALEELVTACKENNCLVGITQMIEAERALDCAHEIEPSAQPLKRAVDVAHAFSHGPEPLKIVTLRMDEALSILAESISK